MTESSQVPKVARPFLCTIEFAGDTPIYKSEMGRWMHVSELPAYTEAIHAEIRERLFGDEVIEAVCVVLDEEVTRHGSGEPIADYAVAKRLLRAIDAALGEQHDG